MKRTLAALAASLMLTSSALAGQTQPPYNIPSIADWEQLLLQNLTGANGVPLALGASPVASGACAIKTQTGGQAAGEFQANGACSASTVILTFLNPAPNGFECGAKDITTTSDTMLETAFTTTTVTFTGTMANNDFVVWSCRAF